MTQPSFAIPTLAVLLAGAILGCLSGLLLPRIGQWRYALLGIGGIACLWFGPQIWALLSLALIAPGEPLAPTGRTLASLFYGAPLPLFAFAVGIALVARRFRAN